MRMRIWAGALVAAASAVLLALPGAGFAGSANPASFDFGSVALNTTVTKSVTITIDAGYSYCCAGGISALNPPYSYDGDTCGNPSAFTGPGTCTIKESFSPTALGAASADLAFFECPTGGGSCITIPVHFDGTGVNLLAITTATVPGGTVGTPYPATTLQASGGTPPVSWTAASLPAGLALNASTGTITGTPTAAGTFTFTVTATDSGTPTPQTATKSFTVTIIGSSDLALSLTAAPKPVQQSKPVTITVAVRDLGPSDGTGVVVTDVLPSASQFVSVSTSQGSCTAPPVGSTGTMRCSLGTIANGGTATITIVVKPTLKKGTMSNSASVSTDAATTDPVAANNAATVDVQVK